MNSLQKTNTWSVEEMRLIIFDTNAWLNLYTINPIALNEFINKFSKKKGWFWIPEQVYWEFNNHSKEKREGAIKAIERTSGSASDQLHKLKTSLNNELRPLKNNCILEDETLTTTINDQIDNIVNTIKDNLKTLNTTYQKKMDVISESNDIIIKLVQSIYDSNPAYHYTSVQRIQLYEEGELRIKYHIPPGLTDTDKNAVDKTNAYRQRYGDFLIWKDLLKKTEELLLSLSSTDSLEVIFVEEEKKGDWWIERGKPIIAPMLQEEFLSIVNNKATIEMLSFSDFLSKYGKDFNINEPTVSEVVEKNKYKERVITYAQNEAKTIVEHALTEYFESSSHLVKTLFPITDTLTSIVETKDYTVNVLDERQISIRETNDGAYYFGNLDLAISANIIKESSENEDQIDKIENNIVAKICINIIIDYSKGYSTEHYDIGTILFGKEPQKPRFEELKKIVFARDNYTCKICGKTAEEGVVLTIDHIVPLSLGGTHELNNLQTLCQHCNAMKADKILYPYTTCPDCGIPISHWNDGGNGFCINCSPNH